MSHTTKSRKLWKRSLSLLLALTMVAAVVCIAGVVGANATLTVTSQAPTVTFSAPETIYVDPTTGTTQYFADQYAAAPTGPGWGTPRAINNQTNGYVHFYAVGATGITIKASNAVGNFSTAARTVSVPSAGNGNVTLNAGEAANTSGLVTWEATYTINGALYKSYTYSYIYVPDRDDIIGSSSYTKLNIGNTGNGYVGYYDSGLFIVGSHSHDAARGRSRNSSGNATEIGPRSSSADMETRFWQGTNYPADAQTSMLNYTVAKADGGIAYDGIECADEEYQLHAGLFLGSPNNRGRNRGTVAKGYIQVDSSRYTSLSTVPQLKLNYILTRALIDQDGTNSISRWISRGSTTNREITEDSGIGGGSKADGGTWIENPWNTSVSSGDINLGANNAFMNNSGQPYPSNTLNGANWALNTNGVTAPYQSFASFMWHFKDTGTWTLHKETNHIHENGVELSYTLRDKQYLRAQLRTEITANIQSANVNNYPAYQAKLITMATALCKPDYSFSDPATQLAKNDNPASLAGLVETAHQLCTIKGPYQARATYRSSVLPASANVLMNDSNNMKNYYLGDNIYGKYDANLRITGYRPTPVAVNVPGSYTPGTDNGTIMFTNATKSLDIDSLTLPSPYGAGYAPLHPTNAINLNCQATDNLEWIWWMEPIVYQIRYNGGDHAASGTMSDMAVQYDTKGTLLPCGYTPQAGWSFVGWQIQGELKNPGDTVENLTTVDGGIITAVAQWKQADPENVTITVDPNGGTPSALQYLTALSNQQYGDYDITSQLDAIQVNKDGYIFDGWYFDVNTWTKKWDAYLRTAINSTNPGLNIYAKWTPITSSLQYDNNGATGSRLPAQTFNFEETAAQLWDPSTKGVSRAGYTFLGWYPEQLDPGVDPMAGKDYAKLLVPGANYSYNDLFPAKETERIVYAVWQAKTYTVQFLSNWHALPNPVAGEGAAPAEPYVTQDLTYGEAYGLNGWPTPPERFGATFVGWFPQNAETGLAVTESTLFTPTAGQINAAPGGMFTLYARWVNGALKPFELIMDASGGKFSDGSNLQRKVCSQGELVDLTQYYIPTRLGYAFEGWEITSGTSRLSDDNISSITIDSTTQMHALWSTLYYTVTFESNYQKAGVTDDKEVHPGLSYNPTDPSVAMPSTFTNGSRTLQGFAYKADAGLPDFQPGEALTLGKILAGAAASDPSFDPATDLDVTLYAIWKINGGIPEDPKEEFPNLPDDIPDTPPPGPDYPGIPDPDGEDGYIVMYFIVPKDVQVTPSSPGYRFLTYGKAYGAMPTVLKTDGTFLEWRVIKYGKAGHEEPPLGTVITGTKKVDHEYSIWVAPFFTPGFAVRYLANGGTIAGTNGETQTTRIVYPGKTYGSSEGGFPEAVRENHKFLGWFTLPEGGTEVKRSTIMSASGEPVTQGLTPVEDIAVVDTLFAHWEKTTSTIDDIIAFLKSSLPTWVVLPFLGIGLPLMGLGGIALPAIAALPIITLVGASILGFFLFPLALLLPFLFPVIGALMPIWWPLLLI